MATLTLGNSTAFVDFEIPASNNLGATPLVNFNNPLGNQHPTTYVASQALDVNCVPAVVWDGVVWCGGSGTANAPNTTDGTKPCLIKGAGANILEDATVLSLSVREIGTITVNNGFDIIVNGPITLDYVGGIAGIMTINPDATVTASGATTFSGPSQIKVLADATGVGSFIDNGTINQTNGTADVQLFIANDETSPGTFFMHQVGPTVTNPAFQTQYGYPGVYLGQFDINILGTYAYKFDPNTNQWINIYPLDVPVPAMQGIILSTVDAVDHTLTMTGQLNTGNLTSQALGNTGTYNLISNPYPSAIDFDDFATANSSYVNPTYYLWDATAGNYVTYTSGLPVERRYIQVGQGFFVVTKSAAPSVSFTNSMREHNAVGFLKDEPVNILELVAQGNNYTDYSYVRFDAGVTTGYDLLLDAMKWNSIFEDATEIRTIASDMSELSVNTLPLLEADPVSVPMHFNCGINGEYTITANFTESFPTGTQIFLEDLKTGGEWINLMETQVYTFTASPDDVQARFILHFFGPNGVGEDGLLSPVQIYSSKQYVYIVNNSNQPLDNYLVYDMTGRPVASGSLNNSTLNRVFVSDITGYYLVRVSSGSQVYTSKVYITR